MTRDFTFVLADHTKKYNLWSDVILPLIVDPTFSTSSYVPSVVCELQIYMSLQPAANAGNNVSIFNSNSLTNEASNIITDGMFKKQSSTNAIDTRAYALQGSVDNVQVDISLTAI